MSNISIVKGLVWAVVATMMVAFAVALSTGLADASPMRSSPLHGAGTVSVNVSFQTRLALPDMSEKTLANTQKRGRTFIYNMASDECDVLKATIARTCRLTSINISARIQDNYNDNPVKLYLNGNARFSISLKTP